MSDDTIKSAERSGGVSRRAALKAGVAAGVGVAAWSGPTITSLGGTPAYAQGCTFVVEIDLSGGCRNTDQRSNCPSDATLYGYHELKTTGLPTGYSISNNIPEGTCCEYNWPAVLNFPQGMTCRAEITFNEPPQCTGTAVGNPIVAGEASSPNGPGELPIVHSCQVVGPYTTNNKRIPANTQYRIVARCSTIGAPAHCITG